ncbi:MAG: murein L,D-transpeptidase catalytic domain family protein [Gammaproteobacteria bacterium]|nr:murein L,D-transpeptidase catalytic domain family protein [Gammaproteobacteria bacterium]MDH4310588.1 murein L,D-transpeptidase catalytic domain family protein [Gammaproteobacteria bacterium]MDH5271936.1 murein L,D-transpeptidase catalytic domain family protein [Gammaproteobacteria bacterium]
MRRRLSHGLAAVLVLLATALAAPAALAGQVLADRLAAEAPSANPRVLALAARAAECARKQGVLDGFRHLAVIDYSLPSTQPRLWVFDLERGLLLFQELVAHGRNTGDARAERFSNAEGSHMSSIGLFKTLEPYYGSNGYSLRLSGLDPGFNDNALARAIVMHGAPYVSEAIAERLGRLGRSWGCPALRPEIARTVIDTLKGGALLFAYYPDRKWLAESPYFQCDGAPGRVVAAASQPPTSG